jgi:hypothetical protein
MGPWLRDSVQLPVCCSRTGLNAPEEQFDVGPAIPWYSSWQKKSVLLSVVQHEVNYILSGGQREGVSRTALDVSVSACRQPV